MTNDLCKRGASASPWFALTLSALMLTACTTGPYAPQPPDVVPPTPRSQAPAATPQPAPRAPASSQAPKKAEPSRTIARGVRVERSRPSPAAQAMIEKARGARKSGELAQAASLLERAQRMSPQAAEVYYEMAAVKMDEGAYVQAEQFCQKALSLIGDDARFRANVWQRIAEIREARGDKRGAQEARDNARGRG